MSIQLQPIGIIHSCHAKPESAPMPQPGCSEGDLLDVLSLTKDDRVGMVGFFGPLVPALRQRPVSCIF